MPSPSRISVYVESGSKRSFAGAIEWPGWCRSGKTEEAALEALDAYRERYLAALKGKRVGQSGLRGAAAFDVRERLNGDATTDFGAPGTAPKADERPLDEAEAKRQAAILQASFDVLIAAAKGAKGKQLRKGPRGGGRDLDAIVRHVVEAQAAYLARVGVKQRSEDADPFDEASAMARAAVDAVTAGDATPKEGPRGGKRWTVRYFVRRSAWHALDHAWEIEDRSA